MRMDLPDSSLKMVDWPPFGAESLITNVTTAPWNVTTSAPSCATDIPPYYGYVAVLVSSLLFGSNLVPVKKYETGDGVFFQFIQCITIGVYGIIFNWAIGLPRFEPFAMLAGAMWATGNMACVLVIRSIGLGVGLVLWSLQSLVLGWASGRFGWFGEESVPKIAWLQYLGVALAVIRGIVSMFIKSHTEAEPIPLSTSDRSALIEQEDVENSSGSVANLSSASVPTVVVNTSSSESVSSLVAKSDFLTRMSPAKRQVFGIGLALLAGSLFGLQFAPISHIQQKVVGCTRDWDYSFAFYSGTLVASFSYTVIYAALMRNRPVINPQLILPGFISGLMWVIAQTGWFVTNETLSQAVSFPILSTGPPLIALFWAVVVFREIRGRANMILLAISVVLGIGSVLMVAFSM